MIKGKILFTSSELHKKMRSYTPSKRKKLTAFESLKKQLINTKNAFSGEETEKYFFPFYAIKS